MILCISSYAKEHKILDIATKQFTSKSVSTVPSYETVVKEDTLEVTLTFKYVTIENNNAGNNRISIDGFFCNSNHNEYQWPFKTVNYKISNGQNFVLDIISHEYIDYPITLSITEAPIPSVSDLYIQHKNTVDDNINIESANNTFLPKNVITTENVRKYRGQGFIPIIITPIQYDPINKVVRISKKIKYRIIQNATLSKGKEFSHSTSLDIAKEDDFFNNFVYDPSICGLKEDDSKENANSEIGVIYPTPTKYSYLILTVDSLLNAANKFADWKRLNGYDVKVYSKSNTRDNEWTPENIKERIKRFASSYKNFYYLLIIGDHDQVPGEIFPHPYYAQGTYDSEYMTDFYYSCLDGEGDETSDIFYGRIPTHSIIETTNAINKILEYEKYPCTSPSFYKSAFHASQFDPYNQNGEIISDMENTMFIYSSEAIRNGLASDTQIDIKRLYTASQYQNPKYWSRKYISGDLNMPECLQRPNYSWNSRGTDVVNTINNGCFYGMYNGHGSATGWSSALSFDTDEISLLKNKSKYPIIFSMACSTGSFNKSSKSLAKEFLCKNDGGASVVFAATDVTYSGYNDVLLNGFFKSIWPKSDIKLYPKFLYHEDVKQAIELTGNQSFSPKYKMGEILNFSKNLMSTAYSLNDSYANLHLKLYHCFGDPSTDFTTKVPIKITGISILKESDGFTVSGTIPNHEFAINIAIVDTVSKKLLAYESLHPGKINIKYPDRCKLCITGHNVYPLVLDASQCNGEWSHKAPARNSYKIGYADFLTGTKHDIDIDYSAPPVNFTYFENEYGILTVKIDGAIINTDPCQPDAEEWWIWPGYTPRNWGKPMIPLIEIPVIQSENPEMNVLTLEEADYIDFDNTICMSPYAEIAYSDNGGCCTVEPYTPYTGFFPENITDGKLHEIKNPDNSTGLIIRPVQYDHEKKTMRAYRYLKFRRGTSSGIHITDNESDITPTYLSIDGCRVDNPIKGRIYIECKGNRRNKIIFK